jgi:sRNA-binding regulator protein Hfq
MDTTFKLVHHRHSNVSEILCLIDRIKDSNLRIHVAHEIIEDNGRADVILRDLWPVSMLGKIQIHKSKSGLLYPHLLVYRDHALSTFYPQRRRGEPETTIEDFLNTVLAQNQRQTLVASFYETSKDCIESAKFLYHRRKARSRYEILLTQGIESVLTSFLIFMEDGDPMGDRSLDSRQVRKINRPLPHMIFRVSRASVVLYPRLLFT